MYNSLSFRPLPNKQGKLYINVTVHRNKFIFNNQPDALIIQIFLL